MSVKNIQPRLGRGLSALLGDTGVPATPDGPVRTLPVDMMEPGPFQPRRAVEPEALAELAESIRRQGVLQPILVRRHPAKPAQYQIIAGERRWRASQAAGLHEVPVLLRELDDTAAMAAALVENLQRQDLNAIEEAEGYRRLVDEFGLTQERLGEAVGKSRSHVANAMRLLGLPRSVQSDVQRGALSAGHARALLSHPDPEGAARLVIAKGLNVRQTEDMVQKIAAGPKEAGRPRASDTASDPDRAAVERELSQRLGLRVQIAFDGNGGTVRIAYRTLDQLDGLIAQLSRD